MKLSAVARYFDRLPVYDAYTGKLLFKGQLDLYDQTKRDSVAFARRVLSFKPGTTLPLRSVLLTGAQEVFLLGGVTQTDTWGSDALRVSRVLHKVSGLAALRTPGQMVGNTGGSTAYCGKAWLKDWKDPESSSVAYPYYEMYFALDEPVQEGLFIELDSEIFRARSTYESEAGFLVAEADRLDGARVTVSYETASAYNPASDVVTSSAGSIPAIIMRYRAAYENVRASAVKPLPGDLVGYVRKSDVTAKAGDTLVFGALRCSVLSVESDNDAWHVHIRP